MQNRFCKRNSESSTVISEMTTILNAPIQYSLFFLKIGTQRTNKVWRQKSKLKIRKTENLKKSANHTPFKLSVEHIQVVALLMRNVTT